MKIKDKDYYLLSKYSFPGMFYPKKYTKVIKGSWEDWGYKLMGWFVCVIWILAIWVFILSFKK